MESNNLGCYFCGSLEKPQNIENYTSGGIAYSLNECSMCGAQYWIPFKNPGSEWYEKDERYKNANTDSITDTTWSHRKIISFLAPLKGRVFDIGCGTGNFLRWAKLNGWDVAGIDFDSNAINSAKINFQLSNIELSTLRDYASRHKSEGLKYDLITFFDVFEHIDDHRDFLEQVRELLIPGGYIAMSMPYRLGARWLQSNDLPPRHLTRWDERSLGNFLEQMGFNVKYIKLIPAPFFFIVMKLRFKYGNLFSFGLVNKIKNSRNTRSEEGNLSKNLANNDLRIKIVHNLAKIKDIAIFGIPALLIWLSMLFTKKRYTTLFMIASKISSRNTAAL